MLGHLLGIGREGRAFTGRKIIHSYPVSLKANFIKQHTGVFNPLAGSKVALVIVACPFQAADHIDTVGTFLNCSEKVHEIDFSGTRHPDNFYVCRVI